MTITQTADTDTAARLADRQSHRDALDALIGPVEEAFAAAMRRVLRQVFARVNPGLVADAHLDLTQLATLPDAWRAEIPGLSERLSELYGTGNLTAWLTNAGSYQQAQAAAARLGAPLLPSIVNERALDYIAIAENRLVRVADPLWVVVQGQLHDGMMAGESIEQLAARVAQSFESGEARARTIARTESVGALNTGTMDGVRALGDFGPAFKEWLATDDERTRDDHYEADKQRVAVDEPFIVGLDGEELDYPGDPAGSPGQIVNCRCTVTFTDEPPEGEAPPEPPTDEPAAAETDVIEPPQTPDDVAHGDLRAGRDAFEQAMNELRGFGPDDLSPHDAFSVIGPDGQEARGYEYRNVGEVHSRDVVFDGNQYYMKFEPSDLGGVYESGGSKALTSDDNVFLHPVQDPIMNRGVSLTGDIEQKSYRDIELVRRDAPVDRLSIDAEWRARLEAISTENGRVADETVMRRLEERGLYDPGAERERLLTRIGEIQDERASAIDEYARQLQLTENLPAEEARARAYDLFAEDPRSVALSEERKAIAAQLSDLSNPLDYRREYAGEARRLLDESRGVGGSPNVVASDRGLGPTLDIDGRLLTAAEQRESIALIERAAGVYPSEWIDALNAAGRPIRAVADDGRAFYRAGGRVLVTVSSRGDDYAIETAVHELGHAMEYTNPGIMPVERGFLERRTVGEELKTYMESPQHGKELVYEDKFASEYMGKDYSAMRGTDPERTAHELLTMGAQTFVSPEVDAGSWLNFGAKAMADEDFRQFLLGLLFTV